MVASDFTPAEEQLLENEFQALLADYARTNHRQKVELITRAYHLAKQAHGGVRRLSGEPYMMHPLSVARIVVKEIGLGSTSICAALLHDVAKPRTSHEKANDDGNSFYNHEIIGSRMAGRILKRLKFSTAQISHIKHLIKHHMFYYTKEWTDGAVRRFIRNVGAENLEDLFLLRDADRNGNGSKIGIPKAFHHHHLLFERTTFLLSASKEKL